MVTSSSIGESQSKACNHRSPTLTLTLLATSLLAYTFPDMTAWFQYDRDLIARGEIWRLLTGHLTHWNGDHLFWDATVFATLGAWCEWQGVRKYAGLLLSAAALISAGVWFCLPEMTTYRGLSGIDSALFATIATKILAEKLSQRDWLATSGVALLMLGFIAKTLYETVFDATLFVDSSAAGFTPLPLAHLLGAAAGVALRGPVGRLWAIAVHRTEMGKPSLT